MDLEQIRVRLNWKRLRVNLNITITNGIMINYPHDRWNHRTGFGKIGPGLEMICWRFSVPIYWWLGWFFTINVIELVCLYYKTWWEEVMDTYNAGISLVSNSSTALSNNLLSNVERCNNWLESCCIIFGGILRTKIINALTWSGQFSWVSNNFYITVDYMNIFPCVYSQFPVVVK